MVIVYNPVSGSGTSQKTVETLVLPLLERAQISYTVVETQYQGHAMELVMALDPSTLDGLLVCGGDGLISEAMTGYYRHHNRESILTVTVGLIPCGSANAIANEIYHGRGMSEASLVARATTAAAQGRTRSVDVIEVNFASGREPVYGLSVLGWGLSGTVAQKAADQRNGMLGRMIAKGMRYDIAGGSVLASVWPHVDAATLEYPDEETSEWVAEEIDLVNLIG